MTKSIVPIFVSTDLYRTEKFYADILGFVADGKHDDYLMIKNGNIEIHFSKLSYVGKTKLLFLLYRRWQSGWALWKVFANKLCSSKWKTYCFAMGQGVCHYWPGLQSYKTCGLTYFHTHIYSDFFQSHNGLLNTLYQKISLFYSWKHFCLHWLCS